MTDEPKIPEPNHDSLVNLAILIYYSPDIGYLAECQHCDWSQAYNDRVVLEAEGQTHLRSHPEYTVVDDTEDEAERLKQIEAMIQDFAAEITERCEATEHEWFGQSCIKCGFTLTTLKDQEREENTDE